MADSAEEENCIEKNKKTGKTPVIWVSCRIFLFRNPVLSDTVQVHPVSVLLSRRLLNGLAALEAPYSAVVTELTVMFSGRYSGCPMAAA